ncbi:MAG: SulP family inorganic anion transporter [Fimbriiglobus sp.]|nr:SulP family inorganic anion transporter [Fimbriiglobus sp.]
MPPSPESLTRTLPRDLIAGVVVFLVALPLCLGVALASRADPKAEKHGLLGEATEVHPAGAKELPDDKNVPIFAGLIAGVVGGIVVGWLSGSQSSVAGPAAGLTTVVAAQVLQLGSFQTFLLALLLAGGIQIAFGLFRAGFLAKYFPNAVIKGLLAAIGVILILKQLPHLVGHDKDPEGDFSFFQPNQQNTFTEIVDGLNDFQPGAAIIGVLSVIFLVLWDQNQRLKASLVPAPLVVVVWGVALAEGFRWLQRVGAGRWEVEADHLVSVPVVDSPWQLVNFFQFPDWSQWANGAVYTAAIVIAVVASLETLLNLEAVDKLDPKQRTSPPNRELLAQGVGNMLCGLIGGLPVTSVIVRSSVNLHAGGRTKLAAVWHGVLLGGCVMFAAAALNRIPLSCLAGILIVTGFKLTSLKLWKQMWKEGWQQFVPFATTVVAIVLTDLLVGVLIGLAVSIGFILRSNMRRPLDRVVEKHLGGEVVRINLANQVSFLNRASIAAALDDVPAGGHVLLDATQTDYIDPDILDLIRSYHDTTAPARGVRVSLKGFQDTYPELADRTLYVDYSSREVQETLTPAQVLEVLKDGNERFRTGRRLGRDLGRQVTATAAGQHPLAVLLTCIDSRTPAELVFDLGVGDIFVARVAGNICGPKILGSMEYACGVARAKLIVVLGHTRCGAVRAAVDLAARGGHLPHDLEHLEPVLDYIRHSANLPADFDTRPDDEKHQHADETARKNVPPRVRLRWWGRSTTWPPDRWSF